MIYERNDSLSIASEISRINQNIAAAYTACSEKGATMPTAQNSAHLADTIDSINGVAEAPERKDVNFFDYDGTLLYSYSIAQAAALTSLPDLPSHEGLICQGWNYTLAQIRATSGVLDVGCNYTTDDGSTKLYCLVPKGTKLNQLKICLTMEPGESATIHWGDGTTSVVSNPASTSARIITLKNDYTEMTEDTVLCIRIVGGRFMLGGTGVTVFGVAASEVFSIPVLEKAHIGSNCIGLFLGAFQNCYSLSSVAMSPTVTSIGNSVFQNCYSLTYMSIPNGVTSISKYMFQNCHSLASVSIPASVTGIGEQAFYYCRSLSSVIIPESVTDIGDMPFTDCSSLKTAVLHAELQTVPTQFFNECYCLTSVVLPDSIPQIGDYMFKMDSKLYRITIPASVTTIGNMAFYNSQGLMIVDLSAFTDPIQIPSLANAYSSAFYNLRGKIYVANAEMLSAFRSATNWSTIPADKFAIKEAST